MQKFKFKLDALLKVREFKEKKIKIELGEILKEIGLVENKITAANIAIDESYQAQETVLADPASGRRHPEIPGDCATRTQPVAGRVLCV